MAHKTALITGVGRKQGIGATIALELAREGWDIAFNYWTPYDRRWYCPTPRVSTPASSTRRLKASIATLRSMRERAGN